ncbi:DsbA family protein, partial [Patescibacteria group bacterium]|nr:DsbA family protein [Patescibacteria group bacterium]
MEKEKKDLTVPVLVGLLVIASFLVGSFLTRLKMDEKTPPSTEVAKETPAQPEEGVVLGEDQLAKLEEGAAGIKGEENAPITIVEFSEYQCPYCKRYVDTTYGLLFEEYGDKIRYIFHDYPLSFHPHAQILSEAARCAGDQGKYWEMHDVLFGDDREFIDKTNIDEDLSSFAKKIGLNVAQFNSCLEEGTFTKAVKDDFNLGSSLGVSGTPTFFVNGQMLVG